MAAGDVVSNMYSTAATYSSFQPAAGVVVCVTQILTNSATGASRISGDGDILPLGIGAAEYQTDGSTNTYYAGVFAGNNHKWFIDNSSYIRFYTTNSSHTCGFSGIQTA